MSEDLQITGLGVMPDGGIEVGYVRLPTDLRKNGLLWHHSVSVPRGSDYDDELDDLMESLGALMRDVLEDEALAEPVERIEEDDDEDEDEEEDQ